MYKKWKRIATIICIMMLVVQTFAAQIPMYEVSANESDNFNGIVVVDIKKDISIDEKISQGQSFNLYVRLSSTLEEDVTVKALARWTNGENSKTSESTDEQLLKSSEETEVCIPVTIEEKEEAGEWYLQNIEYTVYDMQKQLFSEGVYSTNGDSKWAEEAIPENRKYTYKEEADFFVESNVNRVELSEKDTNILISENDVLPQINAVRVQTTEIATHQEITISVDYQALAGGLKSVYLEFASKDNPNKRHVYSLYESDLLEGQYTEGTVTITQTQYSELNEEYCLNYANIEDYSGNWLYYSLDSHTNKLMNSYGDAFDSVSYNVIRDNGQPLVLIENMYLDVNDKNNISAGQIFNMVLCLNNATEKSITVSAGVSWESEKQNISANSQYNVSILPGETGKIEIPIRISPYVSKGPVQFGQLYYSIYDEANGDILNHYNYYSDGSYYINGNIYVDSDGFKYNDQVDYVVTYAPEPDQQAPVIKKITLQNDNDTNIEIGTFQDVTMLIEYEENLSGIKQIDAVFGTEENNYKEWFSLYENETSEKEYVGNSTIAIKKKTLRNLEDQYFLYEVSVTDYAGNTVVYRPYDGQMKSDMYSSDAFPQPTFYVSSETELKTVTIESMQITDDKNNPVMNKDNLMVGSKYNLEVTIENKLEEDVSVGGNAEWKGTNKSFTNYGEYRIIKAGQKGKIYIPFEISKYSSVEEWKLTQLNYYANSVLNGSSLLYGTYDTGEGETSESYSYSDMVNYSYFNLPILNYSGEGNFAISNAPYADETHPVINSVTIMGDAKDVNIKTIENVKVHLNYTETQSGIESVNMIFTDSVNNGEEEYNYTIAEESKESGTNATLVLEKHALREMDSNYELSKVIISDFAGNTNIYTVNDNKLVSIYGEEGDEFDQPSYNVKEESKNTELVTVQSVQIERKDGTKVEDKEVAAGDELNFIMAVKNHYNKDLYLDSTRVNWTSNSGQTISIEDQNIKMLAANEVTEIAVPFKISRFLPAGSINLGVVSLSILNIEKNSMAVLDYNRSGYSSWSSRNTYINVPLFTFADGDLKLIEEDTPDIKAPVIESIDVIDGGTDIKVPGTVRLKVKAETGPAQMTGLSVNLLNNEYNSIRYYCSQEDIYYSQSMQAYIVEIELNNQLIAGEYVIASLDAWDEAGNTIMYSLSGNEMTNYLGYSFPATIIQIQDSHITSRDFDIPQVESITVEPFQVNAGNKVTYTLQAQDDSGIDRICVWYEDEQGNSIIQNVKMTLQNGDLWTGEFTLEEDMHSGVYKAQYLYITDSSPHANCNNFTRDNNEELLSALDLTVNNTSENRIFIQNVTFMENELSKMTSGQEAVIYQQSGDNLLLSKEALKIIKEKSLQLKLVDLNYWEILIDGSKLEDSQIDSDVYLGCYNWDVYKDDLGVLNFENADDRIAQSIGISGGNVKFPLTVRYRMSEELLEKAYETGNSRLVEETYEGLKIIKEQLTFTDDGYYVIDYPNGLLKDCDFWISTDTIKYFDYPLQVTAATNLSADVLSKGSAFDMELTITNPNDVALKDVATYILLGDEQCEWYNFESEDASVEIVNGDAVISELKANQTVRLIAKFKVPEDTDVERARLSVVASSLNDQDEELVSYGSDELRLTLQSKELLPKGDITGDGVVDATDLAYMLRVVNERIDISELTEAQKIAGDVSCSEGEEIGTIDATDLAELLKFVNERIDSFDF